MIRRALATVALGALVLAGSARAGEPVPARKLRVALEALVAPGVSRALVDAVEAQLCAAIQDAARAEVVCPADVAAAAALAKEAMAFGACQSSDCVRKMDELREADRTVRGSLQQRGQGLVLSLELVTGKEAEGLHVVEQLPTELDALVSRLPAVVKKLFPGK